MTEKKSTYRSLQNYGVIGDLSTVALVGQRGVIDFMSFPDFDSPTIFAALLDEKNGGYFELRPNAEASHEKKTYLSNTNVLLTRYLFDHGVAEVSDFMPVGNDAWSHIVVRRAKAIKGDMRFVMRCAPRFDYARAKHTVTFVEGSGKKSVLFKSLGDDGTCVRLNSSVPMEISDSGDATCDFMMKTGETVFFVLENSCNGSASILENTEFVAQSFKDTVNYWRSWVARSTYNGRWRDMVRRSALTLKLLTSKKFGSIVAAPTFGLPEELGGERNWDYRYTWIRDGSFTIYALMRLGYMDEAKQFMVWVQDRMRVFSEDHPLQIMYRIDGTPELKEFNLDHFSGYANSRPVRVGNAASDQLQLDIYGELLDSVYLFDKYGEPLSYDLWKNVKDMCNWVCKNWKRADEGIWEVRGGAQKFLFSRVMCWVALDRALRIAHRRSFPAPLTEWIAVRDEIYHEVFTTYWNDELGCFRQHDKTDAVDASSLLMVLMKFISPSDPRWRSMMDRIGKELVEDSLVYRYRNESAAADGLSGEEGTFTMCSFWYIEALARSGDLEKARFFFEKMLGYSNSLGLYSEEIGPSGEALGNFPQAFTHIALISTAFDLDRRLNEAGIMI